VSTPADTEMLRRWVAMSRKRRSFSMMVPLGEMESMLDELEELRKSYEAMLTDTPWRAAAELEQLRKAGQDILDRYECDNANEEDETDCGHCSRCRFRAALEEKKP
jgi:hypothetical protein